MLVKNIKCPVCSGNKVTPNKSMYIYCDYCGSWMGYDMLEGSKELMNVFAPENMNNPLVVEFNSLNQKLVAFAKINDKQNYIDTKLKIHSLEFKLFPQRYGPKGKQPAFQKRYNEYYKAYYEEAVNDTYFDRYTNPPKNEAGERLKYNVENGVVKYEFNDDFKEFIDENVKVIESSIKETQKLNVFHQHPENSAITNPDLLFKLSISNSLQAFTPDIAEKTVKYLGLEYDYIEIPDITLSETNCMVCTESIKIPENCYSVVCEKCGTLNQVKVNEIKCLNCGAGFAPADNFECPYCKSKLETMRSTSSLLEDKYKEATTKPIQKQKGFFSSLFGKK